MRKAGVRADPGTAVRSLELLLLAIVLLTPAVAVSESVSFAADVEPILTQHCVMCHLPGAAQGDHSLYPDAWASMVDSVRVGRSIG